jgi:hypothetical protein
VRIGGCGGGDRSIAWSDSRGQSPLHGLFGETTAKSGPLMSTRLHFKRFARVHWLHTLPPHVKKKKIQKMVKKKVQ